MPDLIVTLSDPQIKVLRKMDVNKTAKQVLQTHVDTWLGPEVAAFEAQERDAIKPAYVAATADVQAQVRGLLGLG